MYGHLFCRVYNEFGWNEYPRVFGEALLKRLERDGAAVRAALDLGCGTGVLCEVLHDHGIETLGIDLSPEMIAIARKRSPGLQYQVGDMLSLDLEERFDLVTCTGDALNHITDSGGLRRVFTNVLRALNPGGLFVFDLLKADEVPLGDPFEAPFPDGLTVRFSATRDADGFTTLAIDGYKGGERAFSERIREKIYDVSVILAALRETGFDVLQCDDRLLPGDGHGATWFVIAKKGNAIEKQQRS